VSDAGSDAVATAAASDTDALLAEYAAIEAEQDRLLRRKLEISDVLAPLGLQDHTHGNGLHGDPFREHTHPFTDADHEHEPRSAEDAPWPDFD
jgi:hypothetical protein